MDTRLGLLKEHLHNKQLNRKRKIKRQKLKMKKSSQNQRTAKIQNQAEDHRKLAQGFCHPRNRKVNAAQITK